MSDRKLASIQKIVDIRPIPTADAIEVCTILGWQCVIAKKDNFKTGDLVIYVECDSILPEKPEYEFLRERKFRVRTIRLKGQISQGLVLPLPILPKGKYSEGDNVTELLQIKKFDPQALIEERLAAEQAAREKNRIKKFLSRYSWFRRMFGKQRGGFPKFIHKTDEDRIQLFPHICEEHEQTPFQVTEKLDGQSGTWFLVRHKFLFWNRYSFGVCSRKLLLNRPDNSSYWQMAKKYNIEKVLRNIIGKYAFVAVQGEICGPDIQDNKYKLPEREMWAFNLVYPDGMRDNIVASRILDKEGIKFIYRIADEFYLYETIEQMLKYSNGEAILNIKDGIREGIVLRNYEKGISFKVVSPEFLLRYKE
jgi:hypothetical protein